MRIILIGCEYAGTTTLANAIHRRALGSMGANLGLIHDHWKIPHTVGHPSNLTDDERRQYLALTPAIKEAIQRHNLYYHTPYQSSETSDSILVGYHIEDLIYSQIYYGYGGEGEAGDRLSHSKRIELRVMKFVPDTVLVLAKASPATIAKRMSENPHADSLVKEKDIELVLRRFDEEFRRSTISKKITLDTTSATVEQSVAEFARKIEPHLTIYDRLRILTHQKLGA